MAYSPAAGRTSLKLPAASEEATTVSRLSAARNSTRAPCDGGAGLIDNPPGHGDLGAQACTGEQKESEEPWSRAAKVHPEP